MVFLAGRPALSWGLRVACRYGTAVVEGAAGAAGGVHGFAPAMTSFVGRAAEVDEVAGLVGKYRLVTMTGPGGVGKTRLATVVARAVAGRFADGVWLAEPVRPASDRQVSWLTCVNSVTVELGAS